MAIKPSILPRWARSLAGALAANVTAPLSGQQDTGYAVDQVPSSSELNWLLVRLYDWVVWLSEGRSFRVPAAMAVGDQAPAQYVYAESANPGGFLNSSTSVSISADFPVTPHLAVGDILRTVTVDINESAAGGETVNAKIYRIGNTGTRTQLSTTKTSGTGGGDATLAWTSADAGLGSGYTVVAGEALVVTVDIPVTALVGAARCYGVTIN